MSCPCPEFQKQRLFRVLNQTADEMSVKLFIRGLNLNFESNGQCG